MTTTDMTDGLGKQAGVKEKAQFRNWAAWWGNAMMRRYVMTRSRRQRNKISISGRRIREYFPFPQDIIGVS